MVYDLRYDNMFYNPLSPYEQFVILQKNIAFDRLERNTGDVMILTCHPPTITLGARSTHEQLSHIHLNPALFNRINNETSNEHMFQQAKSFLNSTYHINLVKTNRGGSVWYHDRGVLQLYLIMAIQPFGIHDLIYRLEEVLLHTLLDLGVCASRASPHVRSLDKRFLGIWAHDQKIAALGMRVQSRGARFVSMFGASININHNLSACSIIDPCGIRDCYTTSVAQELNGPYDIYHSSLTTYLYKHITDLFNVCIKKF